MQLPVLLEPIAGNGFRARGSEPFGLSAEGATRAEALAKLKEQVQAMVSAGAEIVSLEMDSQPHPWMEFAGMFKDDPLFDAWQKSIAEYRREVDNQPDYL
jgi:predicted RNase H-like HicB family nuclease